MNRKLAAFVALAVVLAAVFVRLGAWQLDRLQQRRAYVRDIGARLARPSTRFDLLPDTQSFQRASVAGTPDFANEIVYTGRSLNGSPGVYILTPVRPAFGDSAVMVIRGWVYAPDAATVDLPRWRESRTAFSGYVAALSATTPTAATATTAGADERRIRTLSAANIRGLIPYPVAGRYLVSLDSASPAAPARLEPPVLGNGPHLSYAIQWFAFATIALAGAAVVIHRSRSASDSGSTGA